MRLYVYNTKILRIVDGDTVEAEIDLGFHLRMTAIVRMLHYNAPEMKAHAKTPEEANLGIIAKEVLTGYVLDKTGLTIQTQLDRSDKYGRILGALYTSKGVCINARMFEEMEGLWDQLKKQHPNVYTLTNVGP